MKVCMYFQVHQPFRLGDFSLFDIGSKKEYFDEKKNREIMKKVAMKCYRPMNDLLLKLAEKHGRDFKVAFSISGTAMEQFERYCPEVIEQFRKLVKTGSVELLSETYYHSLAFLYDKDEFEEQVMKHTATMQKHFGITPKVFRNTELIYNNELARYADEMGYKAILAEGADHVLGKKSPNHVYRAKGAGIRLLLKNYKLSDDVAFRFSNRNWEEHPLSAEKYVEWIRASGGKNVNLFMDYETFGEHQWEDSGIFEFFEKLPETLLSRGHSLITPSELADERDAGEVDIPTTISWADVERDLSAWMGNQMQKDALERLYALKPEVLKAHMPELLEAWRKLTTSDHFYYMCVKWFSDGDVHKYFNPYESPYDGFIMFMNVLNDISFRLEQTNNHEWLKIGGVQ